MPLGNMRATASARSTGGAERRLVPKRAVNAVRAWRPAPGRPARCDRTRKAVDSCWTLDIIQLSKKGCLRSGCISTCQWIDGNGVFLINLRAEAERLHIRYKVRVGVGEWKDVADIIPIVHLHCRFGGSRPYFICPGDGAYCKRRVTKLHLSHRYLLCRHCNQLAYASQYEQSWERALRRANKLKQRLGIGVGIADPFPEKPKGMWTRTYGCLLDEILQAEILAHKAQSNMFKRWAQVKNDVE